MHPAPHLPSDRDHGSAVFPVLLDIPFKGDKTYLHAADIWNALVGLTGARTGMRLVLDARPDGTLEVDLDPAPGRRAANCCGRFMHVEGGTARTYRLRRRPDATAPRRIEFDEARLVADALLAGDGIRLPAGGVGSFSERLLALGVRLLCSRCPGTSWWLAELALARRVAPDCAIAFRMAASVGGRFWKGDIEADGSAVGYSIFARTSPPSIAAPDRARPGNTDHAD